MSIVIDSKPYAHIPAPDRRYSVYRCLHADIIYVQPIDHAAPPDSEKIAVGRITTFSHLGAVSVAELTAGILKCSVTYIGL